MPGGNRKHSNDAAKSVDCAKMELVAEVVVGRYFDHYLEQVFPKQIEQIMSAHNDSTSAHGGVLEQFKKLKWSLMGVAAAGGIGGVGLTKLLSLFGG